MILYWISSCTSILINFCRLFQNKLTLLRFVENPEMKVKTIQILWHNKQPIYTADFEPFGSRLATGGADSAIRVLYIC